MIIFAKKVPTISEEVFPPRKDSDMESIMDPAAKVPPCYPAGHVKYSCCTEFSGIINNG